jgi:hypothetical protein
LHFRKGKSELLGALGRFDYLDRADQGLGRDAPFQKAYTSQFLPLIYEGYLFTQSRTPECGNIATSTTADDGNFRLLSQTADYHCIQFASQKTQRS